MLPNGIAIAIALANLISTAHATGVAPAFTLDGQLYADARAKTRLLDTGTLTLQILNPAQDCVLYEETQTFDTTTSEGAFHASVGSPTGAPRRNGTSGLDSNNAMATVYSNSAGIPGKLFGGAGCTYVPSAGDVRYLRVQVLTASDGATRTLTPNMALESSPSALVAERAESLRGLGPNDFLQLDTPGNPNLTQANLESLLQNLSSLNSLLAGSSPSYMQSGNAGAALLPQPTSPPVDATAAATEGQIWYDGASHQIRYSDGAAVRTIGSASAPHVTNMATLTNASIWVGDSAGLAQIRAPSGDVAMTNLGAFKVRGIQNVPVNAAAPTASGQVLRFDQGSGTYVPAFVAMTDLRSTATGTAMFANACSASQTLTYNAVTDAMSCQNITLSSGQLGANAVTTAALADDSVTSAKLNSVGVAPNRLLMTNATTGASVRYATCATDEILKYGAGGWACASVSSLAPVTSVAGKVGAVTLNAADVNGLGTAALLDYGTSSLDVVQLDAAARLPAVDASLLTGVNASRLQTRDVASTAPTAGQVLAWNATSLVWEPTPATAGSVTQVATSTGLLGGPITSSGTLAIDVGAAAGKIVQENANAQIAQLAGSSTLPAYAFNADPASGLYLPATSQLALATNGTARLSIAANGNVGIGSLNPAQLLSVSGGRTRLEALSGGIVDVLQIGNTHTSLTRDFGVSLRLTQGAVSVADIASAWSNTNDSNSSYLKFSTRTAGAVTEKMRIDEDGNVGIGTTAAQAGLDVATTGTAGSAIIVPRDSAANRPAGVNGMLRYNTDNNAFETFANGGWQTLAAAASGGGGYLPLAGGTMTGAVLLTNGTVGAPSLAFANDATTGLYSSGAGVLNLATAGTARMNILANGNVGIGTTNPTDALHIIKDQAANTGATVRNSNSGGSASLSAKADVVTTAVSSFGSTAGNSGQITSTGHLDVVTSGASTNLRFYAGGTNRMIVTSTGSVGIGTSGPTAPLDVSIDDGVANGEHPLLNARRNNASSAGVSLGYRANGTAVSAGFVRSSGLMPLHLGTTGVQSSLVITTAGNVGIGSSTPAAGLDVATTGTAGSAIVVPRDSSTNRPTTAVNGMLRYNTDLNALETFANGGWQTLASSVSGGGYLPLSGGVMTGALQQANGSAAAPGIAFANDASTGVFSAGAGTMTLATAGTARLTLNATGLVGIGSQSPVQALDVVGDVNASGWFRSANVSVLRSVNGGQAQLRAATAKGIDFIVNGNATASVTVDANGNFGVGTTAPQNQLSLGRANLGAFPTYTYTNLNDQAVFYFYKSSANAQNRFLDIVAESDNAIAGSSPGSAVRILTQLAGATSVTEAMRVDTSGNVGIGTATPGSALDVKGTLRLSGATSGYVGFAPAASAGSTTYTLPAADGTSGYVLTTDGAGILSWSSAPTLISNSNTSTYTPSSAAASNPSGTGLLINNQVNVTNSLSRIVMKVQNAAGDPQRAYLGTVAVSAGNAPAVVLGQQTGPTAYAERLRLDAGGSLGIGTTAPAAGLDVATTGTIASAIVVPRDSTTNRPSVPVNGMLRYNTASSVMESFVNGTWQTLASSASGGGGFLPLAGGTMTGALASANGTVGAPGVVFANDATSGLYSTGSASLSVAITGTAALTVTPTAVNILATTNGGGGTSGQALNVSGGIGALGPINGASSLTAQSVMAIMPGVTAYTSTSATLFVPSGPAVTANNSANADTTPAILQMLTRNSASVVQRNYVASVSTPGAGTYGAALVFGQQTGATAYAERMRIDANGKVGIGTTAPQQTLDIIGTLGVASGVYSTRFEAQSGAVWSPLTTWLTTGATDEKKWDLYQNNSTIELRAMNDAYSNSSTALKFARSGITINSVQFPNGNVGVGTTSPGAKLDVAGHVANSGAAASVGTCGTSPAISGNDTRGLVTLGTGGPTTCTVTFAAAFSTAPHCVITAYGGDPGAVRDWVTATTTTLTLNFSATPTASQKYEYQCMQ